MSKNTASAPRLHALPPHITHPATYHHTHHPPCRALMPLKPHRTAVPYNRRALVFELFHAVQTRDLFRGVLSESVRVFILTSIAVFDSGLGSLSVIWEIRRHLQCDITYLADQKNFPYGTKTAAELRRIISDTIRDIRQTISPDFIVVASNTPSVILNIESGDVLGIRPPLRRAEYISKTKKIAILGTASTIKSRALGRYIAQCGLAESTTIARINSSELVNLVESGDFLTRPKKTRLAIRKILEDKLADKDVATLSSTHLAFLKNHLEDMFPDVVFLDPAEQLAKKLAAMSVPQRCGSLRIYSTDTGGTFVKILRRMGVRNMVASWPP